MSGPVIVVSPDELRAIVRAAVTEALEARSGGSEPAEWLDAAGAAQLLGVHRRTVARMAKASEIPSSRVGKLLRFERRALLAWLDREGSTASHEKQAAPARRGLRPV